MKTMKRASLVAVLIIFCVGLLSVGTAYGSILGGKLKKKQNVNVQRKSILVFQLDQPENISLPDGFGVKIAAALRDKLGAMDTNIAILFSDRLSVVKRGKDDNSLKSQDITPPFSEDNDKPLKLAKILFADTYITGNIESVSVDTTSQTSSMTVSGSLYDGKTGNVLKTWVITGRSPEMDRNANDDELIALAAGQVVDSIVVQLNASELPKSTKSDEPAK